MIIITAPKGCQPGVVAGWGGPVETQWFGLGLAGKSKYRRGSCELGFDTSRHVLTLRMHGTPLGSENDRF